MSELIRRLRGEPGENMKSLCIYHGNCADGFGAAWAVRLALGENVEFYPGVHQDAPPDTAGREVIFVDFSYKRDVLIDLASKSKGVLVLDHHKSALEDLEPDGNYIVDFGSYSGDLTMNRFRDNWSQDMMEGFPYGRIYTLFDMERSGAGIAWDFFHPGVPRPRLIDHIEDRDLWRFKLPHTREIQAAIFSLPYEFDVWDPWFRNNDLSQLVAEGAAIERKHHKDIAELTQVVTRPMTIGGHTVPMANLPYTLTSDAGHLLCGEDHPFAGCYWDTPEGRVFSLRSRENGVDVGEIAKQYGGGGHKHASGFRIPYSYLAQFEPESTAPDKRSNDDGDYD